MIIGIFLAGMLVAIPAIYIEQILKILFTTLPIPSTLFFLLYFLFGIAFVEESLKYVVVRIGAFSRKVFDEPLDVMLYMIISALGFAAAENILLLFKLIETYTLSDVFLVNVVRFAEAIFCTRWLPDSSATSSRSRLFERRVRSGSSSPA